MERCYLHLWWYYLFSGSKMQPGNVMCFLNFYTLVFWPPLVYTYHLCEGTHFLEDKWLKIEIIISLVLVPWSIPSIHSTTNIHIYIWFIFGLPGPGPPYFWEFCCHFVFMKREKHNSPLSSYESLSAVVCQHYLPFFLHLAFNKVSSLSKSVICNTHWFVVCQHYLLSFSKYFLQYHYLSPNH